MEYQYLYHEKNDHLSMFQSHVTYVDKWGPSVQYLLILDKWPKTVSAWTLNIKCYDFDHAFYSTNLVILTFLTNNHSKNTYIVKKGLPIYQHNLK